MIKLQALTKALIDAGAATKKIYSAMDQGVLIPTGRDLGQGVEVGMLKYDALIIIENYPDSGTLLMAFITAWLQENDPDREDQGLADPEIDISLNDNKTADVQIQVEFEEALQIIPDEDGPISYQDQKWKVADVPIDVAESIASMEGSANG